MAHRIAIIASGETERIALPHLCRRLNTVHVEQVLVPPRHGQLTLDIVRKLLMIASRETEKVVVLLDADGKDPGAVTAPFMELCAQQSWNKPVLVTYAQWHLEAWFFGDQVGLRSYLDDKALGPLPADPDQIRNPKLHLKNLLPTIYTSRIAGAIAQCLDPEMIRTQSGSIATFLASVQNGSKSAAARLAG